MVLTSDLARNPTSLLDPKWRPPVPRRFANGGLCRRLTMLRQIALFRAISRYFAMATRCKWMTISSLFFTAPSKAEKGVMP